MCIALGKYGGVKRITVQKPHFEKSPHIHVHPESDKARKTHHIQSPQPSSLHSKNRNILYQSQILSILSLNLYDPSDTAHTTDAKNAWPVLKGTLFHPSPRLMNRKYSAIESF